MNTHRAISIGLAVVAATLLATSTLGYSSMSAERGVSVSVVDAENAYVGVQACNVSAENASEKGANPVRVWVTNQYSAEFTVEKITADTGDSLEPPKNKQTLAVGDRQKYESLKANSQVTVHVTGALDATVTVDVESKENCPLPGTQSAGESANDAPTASGNGTQSAKETETATAPA